MENLDLENYLKDLRLKAELALKNKDIDTADLDQSDLARLIYELQVHQVELEMQNEELRGTAKALEASQITFADFYQNAPVGFVTLDRNGVIEQVNTAAAMMLCDSTGKLIGKLFTLRIHPEDRQGFNAHLQDVSLHNRYNSMDIRLVNRDNQTVHVQVHVTKKHDADGDFRWHFTLVDVAERKRVEEELRAKETELQLIADTTPVILTRISRDLTYIYVNQAFSEIFGRKREEVIGKPIVEIMGEKAVETIRPYFERVLLGERVEYETEIVYKGVGPRFMNVVYTPERNEHGEVLGWFASIQDVTARKRAEEDLKNSEQKYQNLFQSIDEGFCIVEVLFDLRGKPVDYRLLEINPSFIQQTGLHDAVGKRMRELEPRYEEHWFEIYGRVALTGQPARFTNVAKYLGNKWYDVYASPVGQPEEHKVAILFTDITERKKAELSLKKALQQAQEGSRLLAAMMEHIPMGITIAEAPDVLIKAVSRYGRELTDRPPEQIEGIAVDQHTENWQIFCADGETPAANEDLPLTRATQKGEVVTNEEWVICRPDGTKIPVLCTAAPILDADGRITGGVVGWQDISERKRAMESLRHRAEEIERLLEAVPAAVWIANDPQCHTITGNRIANEFYEAKSKENVSATMLPDIRRFYTPDGREIPAEELPMQKAVATNQDVRNTEVDVQLPSGRRFTMFGSAVPLRDQAGNVRGCIGAFMDITGRKRAEEELRRLNESLEKQVAERTALAEARSSQLQALAVELIEAEESERRRISELVHDDLQQILAAARFQLESVSEQLPYTPGLLEVERMMAEAIFKARQLSHELSPAVLHHTGLMGALEWLCRNMREQFRLEVHLTADGVEQYENMPLKMFAFRAVQELLFNVVKHAGVKNARVSVSGAQGQLTISVSDTGKGFDPSILLKPQKKGGIGLLSLRERVSHIGGRLSIGSAHGNGSRFTLTIPVAGITGAVSRSVSSSSSNHRNENNLKETIGEAIHVLFADDHKVLRQGLIKIISGQPNIIVAGEAVNGLEAVQLARQLNPHVIVMDISMPEMDGIEATRQIKAELPDIRVIGLSMHTDEHILQLMRNAGAEAFVSKTASSAELLRAIYG